MLARLGHIRNWIFDLDNTLYPASANLFAPIEARMTDYICELTGCGREEAGRIREQYFFDHGTTLAGLMAEHGTDPHHFLDFVHDVDVNVLEHNALLADAISRLPGRKLIFTNADAPYAGRVLDRLGLSAAFEAVHDIHATDYRPKPDPESYRGLCEAYAIDPRESLFVEDMARNLRPAKAIGMTTVWVNNGSQQPPDCTERGFIDYTVTDIGHWLHELLGEEA
jgi:putative hydrolase of the HAD superfamily